MSAGPVITGVSPTNPLKQFGNPASFTAAATTQSNDYDRMMKQYEDLAKSTSGSPQSQFTPVTPQLTKYQAPDMTGLNNLNSLASNGGYSDQNIQDLRARGVSPIRSVYASAQRNIDRQRTLQGGYSPNYTAATAKLTRDEAQQVGDANQNVNAGIAQNVASNRLSIAPSAASLSAEMDRQRQAVESENAAAVNRANELNAQMFQSAKQSGFGNQFSTIEGMKSLYGATPGLTSLFGSQVMSAAELENQKRQQAIEQQNSATSAVAPMFR